jgi:hypothetical protein
VMDQYTRRIIGFGIQRGVVDGLALCRMFRQAIRSAGLPRQAWLQSMTTTPLRDAEIVTTQVKVTNGRT